MEVGNLEGRVESMMSGDVMVEGVVVGYAMSQKGLAGRKWLGGWTESENVFLL